MKSIYLITFLLMACNNNQHQSPTPTPIPSSIVSVAPPIVSPQPIAAEKVEVAIESVGNNMAFNKSKIEVPAKSEVHLVLKNNATMDVMQHNWVLVNKGKINKVGAAGMSAGATNNYVDPNDEDVLAHTAIANPGKTVEIVFTAPKYPGEYEFCCTIMGHYAGGMRGTFIVK